MEKPGGEIAAEGYSSCKYRHGTACAGDRELRGDIAAGNYRSRGMDEQARANKCAGLQMGVCRGGGREKETSGFSFRNLTVQILRGGGICKLVSLYSPHVIKRYEQLEYPTSMNVGSTHRIYAGSQSLGRLTKVVRNQDCRKQALKWWGSPPQPRMCA